MNKRRPDCRQSFVWCVLLAASWFACAAQAVPESEASVAAPVQWPEARRVEEWLAREMRDEPRANRPDIAPVPPPRTRSDGASQLAVPAVELVALYGVGDTLAADVRIGSRVHALQPASGVRRPGKGRGASNMAVEAIDGTCLRLRYRATSRTVCLDLGDGKGAVDAH